MSSLRKFTLVCIFKGASSLHFNTCLMLKEERNCMSTLLWLINNKYILSQRMRTWTNGPDLGMPVLSSISALCSQPTGHHLRQAEPNTLLDCSCCRLEKHVPLPTLTNAEGTPDICRAVNT